MNSNKESKQMKKKKFKLKLGKRKRFNYTSHYETSHAHHFMRSVISDFRYDVRRQLLELVSHQGNLEKVGVKFDPKIDDSYESESDLYEFFNIQRYVYRDIKKMIYFGTIFLL